MKLKLKMSMKILATINECLTLATIQLSQNIVIFQTNQWLVKLRNSWWRDCRICRIKAKDVFIFGK